MFIKKIFYKLINRKKYNELKGEQGNKERKAWYETSFRKKISDIQNKIQNNNNLNFLHSGHLGDIIDSLALIKELSKSHKCNLFIESNKKVGKSQHNHPAGQYYLNENMINKILPLLKSQRQTLLKPPGEEFLMIQ